MEAETRCFSVGLYVDACSSVLSCFDAVYILFLCELSLSKSLDAGY